MASWIRQDCGAFIEAFLHLRNTDTKHQWAKQQVRITFMTPAPETLALPFIVSPRKSLSHLLEYSQLLFLRW